MHIPLAAAAVAADAAAAAVEAIEAVAEEGAQALRALQPLLGAMLRLRAEHPAIHAPQHQWQRQRRAGSAHVMAWAMQGKVHSGRESSCQGRGPEAWKDSTQRATPQGPAATA